MSFVKNCLVELTLAEIRYSRKYSNLQGREQEITHLIEQSYHDFMQRHAEKAVDNRAQTHLQACNALFKQEFEHSCIMWRV